MSVTFREPPDSRKFDLNAADGAATFHFYARAVGEANPEDAVYRALLADLTTAPVLWNGLLRGRPAADPLGNGWYDVRLPYRLPPGGLSVDPSGSAPPGSPPPPAPAQQPKPEDVITNEVSLEVGGKPPRLYQSYITIERVGVGGKPAPDYNQAIAVQQDGKVEGVELSEPATVLTFTKVFPWVSWRYIRNLQESVWHTNYERWGPFDRGMMMFMGAHLATQKDSSVAVGFKVGLDFGEGPIDVRGDGSLVVSARKPWHYVWCVYKPEKDAASGLLVTRPQFAYCEMIVGGVNFDSLGMG